MLLNRKKHHNSNTENQRHYKVKKIRKMYAPRAIIGTI